MTYTIYALSETKAVLHHPDVGTMNLMANGAGKIVVSASGDLSPHTTTAEGYVVINKLKSENGIVTIEVPQNSPADAFLRKWIKFIRTTKKVNRFAKTTLTITDNAGGFSILCSGVTPQKFPDRTYDRTSTNLTYTLLAAVITEK